MDHHAILKIAGGALALLLFIPLIRVILQERRRRPELRHVVSLGPA